MSATASLDKETLDTLSDEERAAIEASEYSPEEIAAMQKLAGDQDDADDEDDGDDEDDASADDKTASKKSEETTTTADDQAASTAAADAAAAVADATPAPATVPRYEAKLPEDFDSKVQALSTAEAEAWQKFDDGDLDRQALQAELSRITAERADLNSLKVKAEISQEMTAQTAEQLWNAEVNKAMVNFAKPENGGIDYRKDEAKAADLDQFVKVLANNPANSDKPMDWFLTEAHKRVQALHGIAPAPKRETPEQANARRKPPVEAVPANLSQVPGGDGPGDVGGEFADIDQLDGDDLEAAIARMTPAQRERYAQAR